MFGLNHKAYLRSVGVEVLELTILLNGLSQGGKSNTLVNVLDVGAVLRSLLGTCSSLALVLLLVADAGPLFLLVSAGSSGRRFACRDSSSLLGGCYGCRLSGGLSLGSGLGLSRGGRSRRLRSENRSGDAVSSSSEVGPSLGGGRGCRSSRLSRGSGLCGLGGLLHGRAGSGSRFGVLGLLLFLSGRDLGGGLVGGLRSDLGSLDGLSDISGGSLFSLGDLSGLGLGRVLDGSGRSSGLLLGLLGDDLLLDLLVNLGGILLDGNGILRAGQSLVLRLLSSSRGRLLDSSGLLGCLSLILLLDDVTEDVVQDEVAVGLGGEDESLGELLMGGRLVGNLADDLDDNVVIRGLRIDIGDANLALGEVELLDALVDGL